MRVPPGEGEEWRPRWSRPEPDYPGTPKFPRLLLVAACLIGVGQGLGAGEPAHALCVLFIGYSLTYVNDLPALVAAFAEAAGETPPEFRAVVAGGFNLEDHWQQGGARTAIGREKWDVVVLQQGPSASAEGALSCFAMPDDDGLRTRAVLSVGASLGLPLFLYLVEARID